jgi:hypothetical protein
MMRPIRFVIVSSSSPIPEIKITGVVDIWISGISELAFEASMRDSKNRPVDPSNPNPAFCSRYPRVLSEFARNALFARRR